MDGDWEAFGDAEGSRMLDSEQVNGDGAKLDWIVEDAGEAGDVVRNFLSLFDAPSGDLKHDDGSMVVEEVEDDAECPDRCVGEEHR